MKNFVLNVLSFSFFFLASVCSTAQFGFESNDSILVKSGNDTLRFPWAGGLNYVQLSDFDYDLDGDLDLFVFDRSSHNIRVFVQELGPAGPYYSFAYNAEQFFPSDLRYRTTLVDYDNDGRKDIFTWGIGGLKVYRNVSDLVNGLQWVLFQDIVYTEYPNGISNLAINSDDIPAIVDVDFDGDIDIITPDGVGARMEYHRNQSMELYGIPDSLIFIQKNECWGKFSEDPNSSVINLNDPNPPCTGGNIPFPESQANTPKSRSDKQLHSGATLLALDIDSSGVMDLIMGDDSYNNLTLTINGGTSVNSDSPMISYDDAFPSYTLPVKCNLFPAAFYVDVDFDGRKDLIASPNATLVSFNQSSVLVYKNIGTNALPVFTPTMNNFLQAEMIEHGTGTVPLLMDYNEDGLKDLLVANLYRYKPVEERESTIAYYQNTGTLNVPEFTFIDGDVLNLATETYGLRSIPAFGDLDGDDDQDLILGLENGNLVYYENTSIGSGAVWAAPQYFVTDAASDTIDVGNYAFPQIFDLNNDGLLDLLVGNAAGTIHYYQNTGTATNADFTLFNANLGNVDLESTSPSERGAPHFFRTEGRTCLFAGSLSGRLIYYDSIDGNLNPGNDFTLVSPTFLNLDFGAQSAFWVEDLDNDGRLNMFVGQDLGGLSHFEVDPASSAAVNELQKLHLAIYPNPASGGVTINSEERMKEIKLLDMRGRTVWSETFDEDHATISLNNFQAGVYLVSIHLQNGREVHRKLIIQ